MGELAKNDRVTVRLTGNQYLVLTELREALGCPITLIIRSIILDFLTKNEETLQNIIERYRETGIKLMTEDLFNEEEE